MVNIESLYKARSTSKRLKPEDMEDVKQGLTIHKVKVVGETRKGILLTFKETHLEHKCNRTDIFALAELLQTKETDNFVGKKVFFRVDKSIVRITKRQPNNK